MTISIFLNGKTPFAITLSGEEHAGGSVSCDRALLRSSRVKSARRLAFFESRRVKSAMLFPHLHRGAGSIYKLIKWFVAKLRAEKTALFGERRRRSYTSI